MTKGSNEMSFRIGVDIGGTFTDFTVARESGELLLWKQDSTPDDPGRAVVQGLAAVAEQLGTDVPGRMDPTGGEIAPLGEEEVRAAAAQFREAGVEAVAIAFLWSMLYPEHEQRAAEILAAELPGVDIVCSHRVLPEIREWE